MCAQERCVRRACRRCFGCWEVSSERGGLRFATVLAVTAAAASGGRLKASLPPRQAKWAALLAEPGAAPPPGARGLCPGGPEYAAAVLHFGRCMALTARAAAAAAVGDLDEVAGGYADGAAADLARLQARAPTPSLATWIGFWVKTGRARWRGRERATARPRL